MRLLVKLVRRYVLAGVGIALGVLILNVVIPFGVFFAVAYRSYFQLPFRPSQIADSFTLDETGTPRPGPEHTEEEWFYSFDWAMMLNDAGEIVYRYDLPAELDHPYTTREVVSFTRWYLEDYPVMCYLTDYGALVLGYPKGSLVRYSFYMESDLLHAMLATVRPVILVDLLVIVLPCVLFAWGMHRRLRDVEQGLQELAAGRPVQLAEKGATAALARQLNQTGEHLRSQSERIARRDAARTDWIAGVSHDIRTPLALIFGHAEQLEQDPALPQAARAEAAAIRALMQQCGYTQETVAARLSKSRPVIANLLRLLTLPKEVAQMVREGQLSAGHARVLAGLEREEDKVALARETLAKGYSVRQLEQLAALRREAESHGQAAHKVKNARPLPPELKELEGRVRETLGMRATLSGNAKKGKIVLQYYSQEELERLYEVLEKLDTL